MALGIDGKFLHANLSKSLLISHSVQSTRSPPNFAKSASTRADPEHNDKTLSGLKFPFLEMISKLSWYRESGVVQIASL